MTKVMRSIDLRDHGDDCALRYCDSNCDGTDECCEENVCDCTKAEADVLRAALARPADAP